jgi:acyl-CoA synthetase (NDP forming)
MEKRKTLIEQLDSLFHPRSVAVVGVPREMKSGKFFLMALQDQHFQGKIYPVNPTADRIDGLRAYPSVSAIPDPVDLAIILVPHHDGLSVVTECAAKGVKGAVLFTAGYRETGTAEGKRLEEEIVRIARAGGMRLIGPNCMGIYAPGSGLAFFPGLSQKAGTVGIVSNSGSLANILCRMAPQKGLYFSKVVSLGNECDLTSADFLAYLGEDPATEVIGAYLEGIKEGTSFLETVRDISRRKPVILWKVGLTPEGERAAASHTGAMAGSAAVWHGVVRQSGAISIVGFEAWVDTLMGFSMLPDQLGDRIAIISGPGGLAVSAAEACGQEGLKLAELSPETRSTLEQFVPPTGTSLRNPVDVGLTASLAMEIYIESARAVASDPGVDAVVVIGIGMTEESNRLYTESMIQARHDFGKPFIIVDIPGFDPELSRGFLDEGIPFFETAERALGTYARVRRYRIRRNF